MLTIPQMNLAPRAKQVAMDLQARFPFVRFTSGRRSVESQARAMAKNVAIKGPKWITDVYIHGDKLYDAVKDGGDYETLLLNAMLAMEASELMLISRHLTGDAFDIAPIVDSFYLPTSDGQKVVDYIRSVPDAKLLLREGGLVIWHVQLPPSVEV